VATTAGSPAGLALCADVDDVYTAVTKLGAGRGGLGFGIDGAVIKGRLVRRPVGRGLRDAGAALGHRVQVPGRYPYDPARGIEVQVGRTGVITPVAVLEPVLVGGVTIVSATLHNFGDLVVRDVRVGDTCSSAGPAR